MNRTSSSELRDLAIYVGVGIAMLGGVWAVVAYDSGWGAPSNPARVNWVILGFITCVVYINAMHKGGRFRRKRRFWIGLGGALVIQVCGGILILWNAPRVPVFLWTIVALSNIAVLDQFIGWWTGLARRRARGGPTRG